MAILVFPTITPETQEFGIKYNTQVSTTTFSGIANTVEFPGARWGGSMSFRDMTLAESADLKVFLLELRGASGRFYYGDITHTSPLNSVTGSPTIESGSTRRVIKTTLGASSPAFSPGDYVELGTGATREYKMIIDSTSTGGDSYDLTIEPMIRIETYVGLDITYNTPLGIFLLNTDDQAKWSSRSKAQLSDISLDFIEAYT